MIRRSISDRNTGLSHGRWQVQLESQFGNQQGYDSKMANVKGLLNWDAFEGILRPRMYNGIQLKDGGRQDGSMP